MRKTIRIATSGVAEDYRQSLVPLIIQSLGYAIEWTPAGKADLIVFGPFFKPGQELRWVPRPLRPAVQAFNRRLESVHRPLTLFHTAENLRHDHIPCDYALSFDLAVNDPKHFRFPYWMEMVDWSHEGITGNTNPRFGSLLKMERLMQPLGNRFLKKPRKAAIFASHIREPRATLMRALQPHIEVQGFGSVFDSKVAHHSNSGFTKVDVLKDFAFNLCPENSMYPGYYTEKIPEAFMADCLPVTWTDSNVAVDFNPNAMLNLAPLMAEEFAPLSTLFASNGISAYAEEPVLLRPPTLSGLKHFLATLLRDSVT
jgi:hypothetical protein